MLPTFPQTQKLLEEKWVEWVMEAKSKVFPNHIHPPVQQIVEGRDADFQRDDGEVRPLTIQSFEATVRLDFSDGRGASLALLKEKAREMGTQLGNHMWQMLTAAVDEAVLETGNEVKVQKGNLTQADILRALEMRETSFDEHGKPLGFMFCSPEFAEEMKECEKKWRDDRDFMNRMDEVLRRKRAEFDEREARRRLVN